MIHANRHMSPTAATAVRAELTGDDICSALGVTVQSSSPVLALCGRLIEAGHDPATPLAAYRGNTLALKIRSIGEASKLQVNSHGTGFEPRLERRAASLVAPTALPGHPVPIAHSRASTEGAT